MKLIKINTDHYVVVDDSEITQACYVYKNHENVHGRGIFYLPPDTDFVAFNKEAKDVSVITHSTQPLDKSLFFTDKVWGCERLSLGEVKELIGEVDVEKKAEHSSVLQEGTYTFQHKITYKHGYQDGYNQAIEDNKEKKYTEEDMRKAFKEGMYSDPYSWNNSGLNKTVLENNFIQSLQPKTEWEVEIVDGKLKLK